MNSSKKLGRGAQSWYVLWAGLLVVSANNVTTTHLIAKWVLFASIALAIVAIAQASFWHDVLDQREIVLAWCVLAMFAFGQLLHFGIIEASASAKYGFDFSAYYLAGKVVEQLPQQSLYDLPRLADGRMDLHTEDTYGSAWYSAARKYRVPYSAPFIYPPFFAVVMIPLAHLSFGAALAVWNAGAVLLAIGAVLLSFNLAGVRIDGRLALISGVGLLSFFPFLDSLYCGQIGAVILFLFVVGVWLLSRGQVWLSAFSFALATLIKLTPVLVVPLLVAHRKWRWLAAYGIWIGVLAGISTSVTGWAAYAEFWHSALPAISCGSAVWENTSLVSWIQELILGYIPHSTAPTQVIPAYACQISKLVSLLVYGGFVWQCWIRRKTQSVERGIVAVALLGLATSPISWWHHYTLALLPIIYLWCTMRDKTGRICLALLGLAVGTNLIGVIGLAWPANAILLALAAVTPMLTIAVAFIAVLGKQDCDKLMAGQCNVPVVCEEPYTCR